jgi:hypothetical protein
MIAKLPDYITLAEEVCDATERTAAQATEWLRATGYERTFRDNVLTGLSLKIDGSFRALIDDARAGRVEAMHHLKTMVESFIYFYVVAADTSPETANRLFAKTLHEKVTRRRRTDCRARTSARQAARGRPAASECRRPCEVV